VLMVWITCIPFELSRNRPITGSTIETDKLPSPPIIESPKAPLSGMFSEINASVVGQKKVTPMAKTPAAIKINIPDALARSCNPINENNAENHNIPVVLIFLEIGPAKYRPIIIKPLINASTRSALTPVSLSSDSMRCVVPNSVVAESNIQTAMNR